MIIIKLSSILNKTRENCFYIVNLYFPCTFSITWGWWSYLTVRLHWIHEHTDTGGNYYCNDCIKLLCTWSDEVVAMTRLTWSRPYTSMLPVSWAIVAGVASPAENTDPSWTLGLTFAFYESMNVHHGSYSVVCATVIVHQFICILHIINYS